MEGTSSVVMLVLKWLEYGYFRLWYLDFDYKNSVRVVLVVPKKNSNCCQGCSAKQF